MVEKGIGDYFISDADDETLDDDLLQAPVVIPPTPVTPPAAPTPPSAITSQPVTPAASAAAYATSPAPSAAPAAPRPPATVRQATREERLARALDELIQGDPDIQAAALVSMDGFTMASALPDDMQADRVGAMSAAILGLGERAAAELGRGPLSQVFIEGEGGYVLLTAAGDRAVLTVMASPSAKLGLVLYDMKTTATRIAEVLS
ncbi:MAG: roadblock/LC7 domain-containing protein [Coriobacteriales bacterium]